MSPLWAGYKEDEPEPEPGGDRARVLWAGHEEEEPPREEEEVRPAPEEPEEPARPPVVIAGVLAVVIVLALVTALSARGSLLVDDLPSAWGDVPMSCDTTRVEQQEGAVELFRCRALGGRGLPPGLYRSPQSQWTSDVTRIDARASVIRIARDGELIGWAAY